MARITNEHLADTIKIYHNEMKERFERHDEEFKNLKDEVCLNSDMRKQAKTTMGFVTFIATTVGGAIVFLMNKFWK